MNQYFGTFYWRRTVLPGSGQIGGSVEAVVTVAGEPAARRVLLYWRTRSIPVLVDAVWSDSGGRYAFKNLDESQAYLVIAVDHTKQYEPSAWDWISPAVIE